MRDWRSGIITVTVRDSRNREHDPIIGVVPLKLSDILETSSQVTRWYPLDGGIGFGRIRISLLFRSIETRLPPQQLGWDVGTVEFMGDRVVATDFPHHAKIKMRTGGSIGKIGRHLCHNNTEGSGYYWDLSKEQDRKAARLPVKFRYRSPVVFEFHVPGKRSAEAYAIIWLHHLNDNEPVEVDLPICKTKSPARLTQNYITEQNYNRNMPGLEDLVVVGRLKVTLRFKAGMDESHEAFVADNDSRETYETWEACVAEGVRQRLVEKELPDRVQTLHDESLSAGRDVLKSADQSEKQKWLTKEGTDWSGAFGQDPQAYMDAQGRKRREPGRDDPLRDPNNPGDDDDYPDEEDDDDDDDSDLGVQDGSNSQTPGQINGQAQRNQGYNSSPNQNRQSVDTMRTNTTAGTMDSYGSTNTEGGSPKDVNKQNKRTEERKQRGLMQWKPARNAKFAKDESIIGLRRLKAKITGGLDGRQPGVETETG